MTSAQPSIAAAEQGQPPAKCARGRVGQPSAVSPVARPKLGPQCKVRAAGPLVRATGRPDDFEREQIAATVGARLRELRAQFSLSLRDVERRSGVNRSTISRVERGLRRPRASMLGWLAWGIAGPDGAGPVKAELCEAAGISLICESRWSERSHDRHAWRALLAGGLPLAPWLAQPWMADVFGAVMPNRLDDLRRVQEAARRGEGLPWPEHVSAEALWVADMLDGASRHELAAIGRGVVSQDKATAARARRKRAIELRAELGLTGWKRPRPRNLRWRR